MKSATRMYALCAIALLLEACASFFLQVVVPRDGDIAIHLNAAQRILAGEKLYRDIITASFPMQFYLRIPGIMLARRFNLDIFTVAAGFDHFIALLSLGFVLAITRKTNIGQHPAVFPFLAVIIGCVMFVLPAYQRSMGEKEYFLWLFTLPYFILAAARTQNILVGRAFRIVIGIFAALGFCYKPFFALPLLLVEAYLCWHEKSWRTLLRAEFVSAAAMGAAYSAWMLAYFPEYRTIILPIGRFYYNAGLSNTSFLIEHYSQRLLPFLLASGVLWAYLMRTKSDVAAFFNVLCLAILGFGMACLVQMKGYFSHLFPTLAMTITAFAYAASFLGAKLPRQQTLTTALFAKSYPSYSIIFFSLLSLMLLAWYTPPTFTKTILHAEAIIDRTRAIHMKINPAKPLTIYLLSTELSPMFPQGISFGLPWDYHFYHLWLLEGVTNFKAQNKDMSEAWVSAQTGDAELLLRTTVTDDMERLKPAILLVDRRSPLDFINYFSQEPRFAELLKHYSFQKNFYEVDIYARNFGK